MTRIYYTLKILVGKFGFNLKYILIPVYRILYSILLYFGLLIDEIFFRSYRKKSITKPIFLIGHPRSGTTFLHKFLIKNNSQLEGMYLWRMIFSTLLSRFIFKPILGFIDKLFPKNLYDPKIHKTGFLEPETDDVAYFFKRFNGMFFWLYFNALKEYPNKDALEKELIKDCELNLVLDNLETLYKKNLFTSNKRIFSKSFSLILDIKKVKDKFSDSKIIILIRDPLEVIPSCMSLARNVQSNINKFEKLKQSYKNNYYRNLYYASQIFYEKLISQLNKELKENEDYILVNYKDFLSNFDSTIRRISEYCDLEIDHKLKEAIKKQEQKQQSYRSKHNYCLEEFGLSKDEILKDFNFLYEKFTF